MVATIRLAVLDDVPTIQRVGIEADARFAEVGHPELADGKTIPTAVAEKAIPEGRLLVSVLEGAVVGWAYVGRLDGEPYLGQISVAPAAGRRGVGTALLQAVLDRLREAGDTSLVLNTQDDVAWNRPWYERHGFVVIPRDAWTPALEQLAAKQVADGIDGTRRVHMRRLL